MLLLGVLLEWFSQLRHIHPSALSLREISTRAHDFFRGDNIFWCTGHP
jgi:hypothetical protein